MKKFIEIGKVIFTLSVLAMIQIACDHLLISRNGLQMACPPCGIIAAAIGLAGAITGGAMKGAQAKKQSSASYKQQLIDSAVAARKAQEEAKKNKKITDTLMIAGASLTILGISFALYLNSLKQIKA